MEELKKKLRKRARTKYLQQGVLSSLIDLDNERKSHYLKATTCCRGAVVSEGKLTMRYCRSRVCQVCNRNRSGRLINAYAKQLEKRSFRFLTLTIPNVKGEDLKKSIEDIKTAFLYCRRKVARGGRVVNGLYTIEVTYNWKSDTFHPHIHALIDSPVEESFEIVKQWIKIWRKNGVYCSRQAQDSRSADRKALSEVFKYAIKFDVSSAKEDGMLILKYSAKHIDTIVAAMWGKRMVITFGDIRAEDEEYQEEAVLTTTLQHDVYLWSDCDWFSVTTGEELSGYTPYEFPKDSRRPGGPPKVGEAESVPRRTIFA